MVVNATTALFICISQQNVRNKESKHFYYFMSFCFYSSDYDRLVSVSFGSPFYRKYFTTPFMVSLVCNVTLLYTDNLYILSASMCASCKWLVHCVIIITVTQSCWWIAKFQKNLLMPLQFSREELAGSSSVFT
jgi:hypothetical protein